MWLQLEVCVCVSAYTKEWETESAWICAFVKREKREKERESLCVTKREREREREFVYDKEREREREREREKEKCRSIQKLSFQQNRIKPSLLPLMDIFFHQGQVKTNFFVTSAGTNPMKSFQLVKTKIKVPYWCFTLKIASVRLVYFNIQLNFHLLTSSKVKAACLPQIKKMPVAGIKPRTSASTLGVTWSMVVFKWLIEAMTTIFNTSSNRFGSDCSPAAENTPCDRESLGSNPARFWAFSSSLLPYHYPTLVSSSRR